MNELRERWIILNSVIKQDFEYIYNAFSKWNHLIGKNILITGATGLVGSLLSRYICFLNDEYNMNISMILLVRDKKKADETFGIRADITYVCGNITEEKVLADIYISVDYIIHCAAETKSKVMIERPVEVSEGIINGTSNVLKLAKSKNVLSAVYLSSMEVYGQMDKDKIEESDLGFISLYDSRSCYPCSKRMAEVLCHSYHTQYGVPVKIARLAQTFGAGTPFTDTRVFAQFARNIMAKEDIILHTDGSTVGNYIYTADALLGIFILLLDGRNGESYNVANPLNSMTVKEMAELITLRLAHHDIEVKIEIPAGNPYGYPPMTKGVLNVDKMMALNWKPTYSMLDMYARMITYWLNNVSCLHPESN